GERVYRGLRQQSGSSEKTLSGRSRPRCAAGGGRTENRIPCQPRQLVSPGAVRQRARWDALHRGHVPRSHRASVVVPRANKKPLGLKKRHRRGRIYRVVPEGFKQPKLPHLSDATTQELVALLESPNGWHRDTAARLLCERQDKSAVSSLEKLFKTSKSPLARMHTLHGLDGLGALSQTHLLKALNDHDALVREHAVRLTEQFAPRTDAIARPLWKKAASLSRDPDIRVRYQLVFALGQSKDSARIKTLAEIARHDADDRWMRAAVLNSLKYGAGEMFRELIGDARFRGSHGAPEFLRQLAGVIGTKNDPVDVGAVLNVLANNADSDVEFLSARGLGDGLRNAGSSLGGVDAAGKLKSMFARAATMAGDARTPGRT